MTYALDADFIYAVAPKFSGKAASEQKRIVAAIAPVFGTILANYGITSRMRIAHFMAQVTHECAGFRTTEEFASGAAYEGRKDLGNVKRGDGRRYKGRGLLQLTGRANYRAMGENLGIDLESEPERAADPVTSLKIACEYWKSRNINAKADKDDLRAVTRAVNGGTNGLEDRRRYLKKAKAALDAQKPASTSKPAPSPKAAAKPGETLARGATGKYVADLQINLKLLGFYDGPVSASFDDATEAGVRQFQASAGLLVDGRAGIRTNTAIGEALKARQVKPGIEAARKIVNDAAAEDKTITKTEIAAGAAAVTTTAGAVREVTDAANSVTDSTSALVNLGPWVLLVLIVVGACGYIIWERRRKKAAALKARAVLG